MWSATLEATLSIPIPFRLIAERPSGDGPFPIVLSIHGYAMDAVAMLALSRRLVPEEALLVAPQGPFSTLVPGTEGSSDRKAGFHWGVSTDPRENRAAHRSAVAAALEWAAAQGGDRERTALLGFSQPCSLDYRLALDPPAGGPLRAVIGICGGIPGEWAEGEGRASDASRACDVLHVSTLEDPFYPLEKVARFSSPLAARFRCATHLVLPGGHRIPTAAQEPVRRFLVTALALEPAT
jgi:predicted esterase